VAPPLGWEALCPDVRQLVLSKLSLPDMASAALTCREFRREFCRRQADEWARLISLGEDTFGKKRMSGFVKVFRHGMQELKVYPGCPDSGAITLDIDASGESALMTEQGFWDTYGPLLRIHMMYKVWVDARVWWKVGGSGTWATLEIRGGRGSELTRLRCSIVKEHAALAMGLILAICTDSFASVLACGQFSATTTRGHVDIVFTGPLSVWGVAEEGAAEDFVGCSDWWGDSFHFDRPCGGFPTPVRGRPKGQRRALSHLQLDWYAR
jgi:hypothetical protein